MRRIDLFMKNENDHENGNKNEIKNVQVWSDSLHLIQKDMFSIIQQFDDAMIWCHNYLFIYKSYNSNIIRKENNIK